MGFAAARAERRRAFAPRLNHKRSFAMPDHDIHSAPAGVEIAPGVHAPQSVLRFEFVRSSGPGGQNVNKVSSKARLHIAMADLARLLPPAALARLESLARARISDAGELIIAADESRSQQANRQACLDRLRELIVQAQRTPKKRRPSKPTKASKQRRMNKKKARGQLKDLRRWRGDES
jgi:ribosome-associated protein